MLGKTQCSCTVPLFENSWSDWLLFIVFHTTDTNVKYKNDKYPQNIVKIWAIHYLLTGISMETKQSHDKHTSKQTTSANKWIVITTNKVDNKTMVTPEEVTFLACTPTLLTPITVYRLICSCRNSHWSPPNDITMLAHTEVIISVIAVTHW